MLEFRILGPVEVWDGEKALPLGGQRQRAVLALLAIHVGEVVPSERLITYLWGESPPPTAAASLQNAVSQLRKALGPEVVETRAPGYALNAEKDAVDARRFEQLVNEARSAEADRRAGLVAEALQLWRGPPLGDFAYEPFAQNEAARLEELRLTAVEERMEAQLELGGAAELVGELEALVRENPLRERPRGQLMLALYRSGRQAEALQVYQDARRMFVDELGIEPTPSLQQLHASILRQESALQPRPALGAARARSRSRALLGERAESRRSAGRGLRLPRRAPR
jgi:DNA-binding SARP family transcriptional activator